MNIDLTTILTILTAGISIWAWNNNDIMRRWIFNPYIVYHQRQYYRFITSGFLHKDYIHLIFNMFVFWMFGRMVEYTLMGEYGIVTGRILFAGLYLLGIIISDLPTFFKHKDHQYYNALGASGGVSAVLFSYVIFYPLEKLCLYGIDLLCFPGILWAVFYIIYSFYMGKKGADHINHDAHLAGGVFGIVFTLIVVPEALPNFLSQLTNFSLF